MAEDGDCEGSMPRLGYDSPTGQTRGQRGQGGHALEGLKDRVRGWQGLLVSSSQSQREEGARNLIRKKASRG